jgi:predicted acyltransferase
MNNGNSTAPSPGQRLYSLDALRGFDMLMIIGLSDFFIRLDQAAHNSFLGGIADQFRHCRWNGFHLYDAIFPLFLFIAGVATPYSTGRLLEKGKTKKYLVIRIVKRALILVVLGIIYNNGLKILPVSDMRFASVLGRIGIAYLFANFIYLFAKERWQYIWFFILLIGYWLLLKFNSAPGFPMGDLTMQGNFVSYIDRIALPGRLLHPKLHDPEGFLSTIPAIGTALMGIFAGKLLKSDRFSQKRKVFCLLIAGLVSLILSVLWNFDFPINKNLWSSSFVLCAGGFSLLLLALFYYVIDVLGHKKWAFFLKVIGMNSILIYMSEVFINWNYTTDSIFHWLGQLIGDPFNIVVLALCVILVKWVFLYILYKKKMFLKV